MTCVGGVGDQAVWVTCAGSWLPQAMVGFGGVGDMCRLWLYDEAVVKLEREGVAQARKRLLRSISQAKKWNSGDSSSVPVFAGGQTVIQKPDTFQG